MVKENTWKPRENLKNAQELVDKFEKEYEKELQ